jgi:hypothetical protein
MAYQLKGGEEWINGVLHGWTGNKCPSCGGHGEKHDGSTCNECGRTGDEWGVMPTQPAPVP